MTAKPCFAGTMMGVVSYRDMEWAARIILECFPEAPCLPVLTRTIRFQLEGIPCLVFDRERRIVYFDLSSEREKEILDFYDRYEADDLDCFATTPEVAPFYHQMISYIRDNRPSKLKWVVFHGPGPLLFGDVIVQADGTPSVHNETLRDILIKGINMKARWLVKKIKTEIPDVEVVADLAETTLVKFTSSAGTGSRSEIIEAINLGFANLNCITWIHCCSNIDWTILTDTNVHVINFDAYQHAENVALYAKSLKPFLERGGMLAWGLVPVVSDKLREETVKSLVQRLERDIERFVQQGIEEKMIAESSWILPACDATLLNPEETDRALKLTNEISVLMKEKYGFST